MMLPDYLEMLRDAEAILARSFRTVSEGHADEPDVFQTCRTLAQQCDAQERALGAVADRYGGQPGEEPERLHAAGLGEVRTGPLGLLRDLQDLQLLATLVSGTTTLLEQAGAALRDEELLHVLAISSAQTEAQLAWLGSRMKQEAPQALVAAGRRPPRTPGGRPASGGPDVDAGHVRAYGPRAS